MPREVTLGALFTALLLGVLGPAGCRDRDEDWMDAPCLEVDPQVVDPMALAAAMTDDKLSESECQELCDASGDTDGVLGWLRGCLPVEGSTESISAWS